MKIIVRLFGGLGNQLFIYAFGRALELTYNVKVLFDIRSGFPRDRYSRSYELDNFNLKIAKSNYKDSLFYPLRTRMKGNKMKLVYGDFYYFHEDGEENIQEILAKHYSAVYFEGYWQNSDYFNYWSKILKEEMQVISPISPNVNLIARDIIASNSVMIHIRRKKYSPLLPVDFYIESVKTIQNFVKDPIFYCFSDDLEWCKLNINFIKNIKFIDLNNDILEFLLMQKCKHFIISNGTYAWWPSWLSDNEGKIIIKPPAKFWPKNKIL